MSYFLKKQDIFLGQKNTEKIFSAGKEFQLNTKATLKIQPR